MRSFNETKSIIIKLKIIELKVLFLDFKINIISMKNITFACLKND